MAAWRVDVVPSVVEGMKRDIKKGLLSQEDIDLIKKWIDEIEEYGPESIQRDHRWDDHALEQEWFGYRSSCFSKRGRIIYRIEENKIVVRVVRVTPTHDYRK